MNPHLLWRERNWAVRLPALDSIESPVSRRHWRLLLQTHLNTHLARKAELQMLSGTLGQHTCLSPHPSNTSRFWVSQELLDTKGSLQLHMAWGEFEKTVLGPGPIEQYLDANTNCLQWSSWPTIFQHFSPLGHSPAQRGYEKWSHLVSPWKACLCLPCCPGAAPDLATVSAHENCLPTLWRNPEGHLWPLLARDKMPQVRMCLPY